MRLALLPFAFTALLGACAGTRPTPAATAERLAFVPRLTNPFASWDLSWVPQEPRLSCCNLSAADSEATAAAIEAFPDCSLSAWEITPVGSLRDCEVSALLALHDGRTRECLGESKLLVGPEPLRVLIAARFEPGSPASALLSVRVYRIEADGLEKVLDAPVSPPNRVSPEVLPRGMDRSESWRLLGCTPEHPGHRVLRCWGSPYDVFGMQATIEFEGLETMGGFLGYEPPAYTYEPLAKWPCPVWMLTLDPISP